MGLSVKKLTKEEKAQLKEIKKEIQLLEKEDKTIRPIAKLPAGLGVPAKILLYENRIEDVEKELVFMLDDPSVKVEYGMSGSVRYSQEISGGQTYTGSVTGMLVGGMLAGSAGVAAGAFTPHSTGIKTKEVKHDERFIIFRLTTPEGIIVHYEDVANAGGREKRFLGLPDFYDKFLKATTAYKRNKRAIDKKYADIMALKHEYGAIRDDYSTEDDTEALPVHIKRQSDALRRRAPKVQAEARRGKKARRIPVKRAIYEKPIFWILYTVTIIPFWWVWIVFWVIVAFTDQDAKKFISEKKGIFVGCVCLLLGLVSLWQISNLITEIEEENRDYFINVDEEYSFECDIDYAKTRDYTDYYCKTRAISGTFSNYENVSFSGDSGSWSDHGSLTKDKNSFEYAIQAHIPKTNSEEMLYQGFDDTVILTLNFNASEKAQKKIRIHYSFTDEDIKHLTDKISGSTSEKAGPDVDVESAVKEEQNASAVTTDISDPQPSTSASQATDSGEKLPADISPYDIKALCERGFESLGYNDASILMSNNYPMGYPEYIYVVVGTLSARYGGSAKQNFGTIQCQANWSSWSIKSLMMNGQFIYKP